MRDLYRPYELGTEKQAIQAKRALHVARMENDEKIVNALDTRYEELEAAEKLVMAVRDRKDDLRARSAHHDPKSCCGK